MDDADRSVRDSKKTELEADGKEMTFELEVAGYDPDGRTVRFVTDSHGTVWDTTVSVRTCIGSRGSSAAAW